MLTSTFLFSLLSQLFLTVGAAPTPLDIGDLLSKAVNLPNKAVEVITAGAKGAFDDILGATGSNVTTSVSPSDLTAAFSRPAFFSRVVYCASAAVLAFSCGAPCDALGADSVEILGTGGDGGYIPRFVIAHDKLTNSIFVAHQGTDPNSIISIANDVNFPLIPIDTKVFPSAAQKNILVHFGFLDTFLRTAPIVLSIVKYGISSTGATTVVLTGHSLGATLATLDALMLNDALTSVSIRTTTFGSPRIGNQAFADFVDASFSNGSYARITNKEDPVPHVPLTLMGFVHAQGEVHLGEGGARACKGQENGSAGCADGVGLLATANVDGINDHSGPYFDGISFGQDQCLA
ncbi:alpha/beta-hydrolase [Desarmillaria tabescens]|uniref:Alpha/beta-hydrolase n=1 Tax=Armillaria tabescens TaxID=1929756 RepID=A0AA39K1G2_ARMTA|nr:alpha/beta-hydrolase [Desarmillaria tabescens]KAK0452770.1 alpha/beta-hydrolase [Desarmillaria tabescens]